MPRIRLNLPLHLYLDASDPSDSNFLDPAFTFEDRGTKVFVNFRGGPPLRLNHADNYDEPHFRSISSCCIEVCYEDVPGARLLALIETQSHQELLDILLPIVNRTIRAIRNFGRVTTAREYRPENKPELLLRAWQTSVELQGEWQEVAPKEAESALHGALYGLDSLDENVERGSLSVRRWQDIHQALVEDLKPSPEDEFLTNALQHLRDENLRLALIEATVCLEIVLSTCLTAHFEVKRHFSRSKIDKVFNNVGLTAKVGLILDLISTFEERNTADLDLVLQAVGWRNSIVHKTGHLPDGVPHAKIHDGIFKMLNLVLRLGERQKRLRAEPELTEIVRAVAEKCKCPIPSIEMLKYHKIKATFYYRVAGALYLLAVGEPGEPPIPSPDNNGLRTIVDELAIRLKGRDARFEAKEHVAVSFEKNLGEVFASFNGGQWKYPAAPTPVPGVLEGPLNHNES